MRPYEEQEELGQGVEATLLSSLLVMLLLLDIAGIVATMPSTAVGMRQEQDPHYHFHWWTAAA